jgi:hypothetical protein
MGLEKVERPTKMMKRPEEGMSALSSPHTQQGQRNQ